MNNTAISAGLQIIVFARDKTEISMKNICHSAYARK